MTDNTQKPTGPRKTFRHDSLDALIAMIREAKPDPKRAMTGREAIMAIEKILREAIGRGVSVAQIVAIMRGFDLELRETTVRSYLRIVAAETKAKKDRKAALATQKKAEWTAAMSGRDAATTLTPITAQPERKPLALTTEAMPELPFNVIETKP